MWTLVSPAVIGKDACVTSILQRGHKYNSNEKPRALSCTMNIIRIHNGISLVTGGGGGGWGVVLYIQITYRPV